MVKKPKSKYKKANKAYSKLIKSVYPSLLNYSKSKVLNKSDAEDVVQETLKILVKKQNDFDKSKNFSGWAFKICYFQIKGYFSKKSRSRIYYSGESEDSLLYSLNQVDSIMPFDRSLEKELTIERQKLIEKISNNLSPRLKVFFNYSLEGKSMKSIISLMNLKNSCHFSTLKNRTILSAKNLLKNERVS